MILLHHKIRGSFPGYIGIELPDESEVRLMDEDNYNHFRKQEHYTYHPIKVDDLYCHLRKPVEGSWHLVIEGKGSRFSPKDVNIIYKAA